MRCVDDPVNASTAGQTDCETTATKAYNARMNRAYEALTKRLPVAAVRQLREAQHAWLAFRDAERRAAPQSMRHATELCTFRWRRRWKPQSRAIGHSNSKPMFE
jgi:uncharacterized protein YecT (DUF1311 family)